MDTKFRMPWSDVAELMALRGWNLQRLAAELQYTETGVRNWVGKTVPYGPASILLQIWLDKARAGKSKR